MEAQYVSGEVVSRYLNLETTAKEEKTDDDFELDPAKVCRIDDPECESCQ